MLQILDKTADLSEQNLSNASEQVSNLKKQLDGSFGFYATVALLVFVVGMLVFVFMFLKVFRKPA
jgi:hypothetical protein